MPASRKKISDIHHRSHQGGEDAGFGIVTYRRGGTYGPRWQANYQLMILHRGSAKVLVDGAAYVVKTGWGMLLTPGHVEEFHFSRQVEARHSWCQIFPGDVPPGLAFPAFSRPRVAKCPPRALALLRQGLRSPFQGAGDSRAAAALVLAILWMFVSSLDEPSGEPGDPNSTALARFHAALAGLGAGKVTLDHLARQAGVSRGHLIKIVRERLGQTPMELVWQERVRRAARLLRETGLSLEQVAAETGFANAYHFSRRFRRQFGQPPRVWRRGKWGLD
jgi:AraC-like DNA-binding protein